MSYRKFQSLLWLLLAVCWMLPTFGKTNVILVVVDGGGEGAYRCGSLYQTGEPRGVPYMKAENGWTELGCTTYSLSGSYDPATHWLDFETHTKSPTDSAASATALNTGHKTKNGRISMDQEGNPLETTAEVAVKNGFAAGAMSNVMPSHATPAAVAAHHVSRSEGAELFTQMIEGNTLSVIVGAAHPWYDRNGEKRDEMKINDYGPTAAIWEQIFAGNVPNGWTYIESREDFQAIAEGSKPAPKKLLGIARVESTFQSSRSSSKVRNEGVPTMTEAALACINTLDANENGFYLMIESGSVDWVGQTSRLCEEMVECNEMIAAICDWIEKNSSWEETTLILTADHETGGVFGPDAKKEGSLFQPPVAQGAGVLPLAVFHNEPGKHTNAPVPCFVKGPGAKKLVESVRCTDETFGKIWGFDGRIIDDTDISSVAKSLFEGK